MTDPRRPEMSNAEREVLKLLWDHGPLPVREVLRRMTDRGQEWTRSTVITLLQRLVKKGYAATDRSRHAFVFRPLVSREDVIHARITDLAGELCDGEALPLVMAFAERHRFTEQELSRFRRMIEELQTKRGKGGRK